MKKSKNNHNLARLFDIHRNRTGVLVCTGPTLHNYVPIENAIHFGVSDAIFSPAKIDYLFISDTKIGRKPGYDHDPKPYDEYPCEKFAAVHRDGWHKQTISDERCKQFGWTQYDLNAGGGCEFVKNVAKYELGDGFSTAFPAAQIALYTGIQTLFLVGVDIVRNDTAFEKRDPNFNVYVHHQHAEHWAEFKEFVEFMYPNVSVISINPVGLKGLFTDIYTTKL